jgi:hypothetical protein
MFSHSYCFFTGFLSTSHSPPLGGSPHRSSSPFGTPRAYGRVPAMASDDELQRSGSATPTRPPMCRLPSTPSTPLLFGLFSLPSCLLSSPRTAFSVSHENRPRDAATSKDWSIALTLSLFVLHDHQSPSISSQRSILDDLATII